MKCPFYVETRWKTSLEVVGNQQTTLSRVDSFRDRLFHDSGDAKPIMSQSVFGILID
jgi:hypothetical protein